MSQRDGPTVVAALVREQRRLPDALEPDEVAEFVSDLGSYRDRAIVLLMLLGRLRAGEVRSLRLADVDVRTRRVRVIGKGGRERVVPVDRVFFVALIAYLRGERSSDAVADECSSCYVARPMTEAGMRKFFRTHRKRYVACPCAALVASSIVLRSGGVRAKSERDRASTASFAR
jgi:integrase/recombinase XerC